MDDCNSYPIKHINSKCQCGKELYRGELCRGCYKRLCKWGDLEYRGAPNDGRTQHPLYQTFKGMKQRCRNPNFAQFADYGGRGVKICDRWLEKPNGFWNFVEDVGDKPEGTTLDRIDVCGDYAPDNVRWATWVEQTRNTQFAKEVIEEARGNGFSYTLIADIDTEVGSRKFRFNNLTELEDFLTGLEQQ